MLLLHWAVIDLNWFQVVWIRWQQKKLHRKKLADCRWNVNPKHLLEWAFITFKETQESWRLWWFLQVWVSRRHCEHFTKFLSWIHIYQPFEVSFSWKIKHTDFFQLIKWISLGITCSCHLIRWYILISVGFLVWVSDSHSVLVRLFTLFSTHQSSLLTNICNGKNYATSSSPHSRIFHCSLPILPSCTKQCNAQKYKPMSVHWERWVRDSGCWQCTSHFTIYTQKHRPLLE